MYKNYIKRVLDFTLSFILLILISPIIIIVGILLSIQNQGNPFFVQDRPGINEKRFRIIKFKTMTDEKDRQGKLLPDNQRLTKLGTIIRKFSLDELPQLFNVIIGRMSLVGPRPLLFKYLSLYSEEQKRRHSVRPGITGWAQVNGRNSISWTKKFELDIYYIDNISFLLDVKIIWLTIRKVLISEGVNQNDSCPMQPFTGKN